MSMGFIWIYLFGILSIIMLVVVPFEKIKELLWFSLFGGFFLAVIVQLLGVSLNFWEFNTGFLIIYNFPLGVGLMWVPSVIIYGYFFNKFDNISFKFLIILIFSVFTTITTYASVRLGFREYINFNIYSDFLLAFILHLILGYYLFIQKNVHI